MRVLRDNIGQFSTGGFYRWLARFCTALFVQGTVKAKPMQLINGKEKLTLPCDCKHCEMKVVGKIKRSVLNAVPASPLTFYRMRPTAVST